MLSFDIAKLREFIKEETMFVRKNIFLSDTLQLRALYLRPGQRVSAEYQDHDAIVYLAEGVVSITGGDGDGKTIGAGSVVVIQRGDLFTIANTGDKKASLIEVVGEPQKREEKIGVQTAVSGDFRETLYPIK